ncbi:MAG: TIGR01459 family HAD-type hydrolase [Phenylobacterium sp.]|uniref:TIGR01459 family HAD-type hydrolase n=1 Tax=Phenylobacterium sp. TaxID=1871053 RepID=UPI00271F5D34|nr:TIGR01459 family HAD-type hydrolase [Phenylobacterium sp.]MDO8409104.1 TIGR01459 family HAD-type hydrolase [Phenylobacterium sp.]
MTAPHTPQGLSDLTDHYDVLLSDVWGVIHNGRESFPQACAALARWRAERGPVILISNSPRPSADVVAQLDALGVPREAWSAFVTSGDATRLLLAERAPGPAWRLGPDRDAPLYAGLGLSFESLDKAAFIACTGPIDDETEGPGDYQARFEGAAARGLEMVCANPDIVVQRGDKLIYCGGALAQLYETLGGKVVMAGKPHAPIYDLCVAQAERLTGGPVARSRMLCIGDGVATDVKGANAQGLDVLFIAAGIHGAETITPEGLDAAAVEALLRQEGAEARFAMAELSW